MKRALFQNAKVQPYKSGEAIERTGFLSAIFGGVIGTAGTLTVTVTHSDDGTEYSAASDKRIFPEKATEGGVLTADALEVGDVVNIDVDLVGLKNFVKFTVSGTAAADTTLAVAIGDSAEQPL